MNASLDCWVGLIEESEVGGNFFAECGYCLEICTVGAPLRKCRGNREVGGVGKRKVFGLE